MKKLYINAEFIWEEIISKICENKTLPTKNRIVFGKSIVILAILLLTTLYGNATTYYSIGTGNWNANTTWSLTSGGSAVGAGIYPIAGDNVIIQGGFTVTLSVNGACTSVQVGGTGNGTLAFGSTSSVTLTTGNVTVNSGSRITSTTNGNQPHSFYISGNINCAGTWDMWGKNATDDINVFLNGTTQNITGNGTFGWNSLTIENTSATSVTSTSIQTINGSLSIAGTLNFGTARFNRTSSGGTLTVSGKMILGANTGGQTGSNFPINFASILLTNGTVEYNFAGAQTVYSSPTYTNVTLAGSGAKTITAAKINGILSMEGTATATGVPTYGAAATLQYKGSSSITTSNNEFPSTFAGTGGVIIDQGTGNTVTLNGNKTGIAGDLNIKSGILNLSTFTANRSAAAGTLTIASGATLKIGGTNTFPSNYSTHNINCTSTTEYSGTNQTVANLNSSQSYGNLTLSGSGTKTLQAGTTTICNNFTITGTASATGVTGLTIGGNVQIDATASFTGGAFVHSVGGNWTKSGTFNATGSTINFNGASSQSIGVSNFNNITFSNSGSKTATGILTIAGDVTIGSNFNSGNFNHPVSGNWTNNGTFAAGTGTITLKSTTAKTIGGSANSQFYNLVINETGSTALGINTSITGTLTLTAGLFDIGTYTLTVANVSGGSSASYVKTSNSGRLKRLVTTGGTVFLFPVGNSAYNPISFSSSAIGNGNSDYFSIRVEDGALTNTNVNNKTVNRKWYLMCATTGVTSLTVSPSYNAGETGALFNAASSPKIGFFTGTAWGYGTGTASGSGPFTVTASGTAPDATSPEAFVAIGSENAFNASKLSITVLPPTPYKGVNSSIATVQSQNSLGVPTWLLSTTTFNLTSNKSFTRAGGLSGFSINGGTHETIINNIEFLESTWNTGTSTYDLTATVTASPISGETLTAGITPAFAILDGSIYKPAASGNWSTVQWLKSTDGGSNWFSTTLPDNNIFNNSDVIQIPADITLTADVAASFYSLSLFGTLDISSSGSLTVNHSTGDYNDYNLQVYGTLKNSGGTLTNSNLSYTSVYVHGGVYWHNMNGGSIPVASWNSLNGIPSTCKVTGVTTTAISAGLDQNFQNFIWDNTSQNAVQTLINDLIVRNTLTLTNGVITTNDKKVIIELGGTSVSTNNSHINGNIRIHIPTTTSPTINFPIGDANYYTPLSVAFTGAIVGSGYLDAYTTNTQPPLAAGLSQSKYIKRIWTVSNTNISGFSSFNTTFTFADTDKTGNPNTDALVVRKLDNKVWAVTSVGTRTANTTECRNMNSFSSFAIGEDDCTPNNYVWMGGTNTDWNTATNWCYNQVPTDTVNVTIPSDPTNQPVIGAAGGRCKNLIISNGASLTITGSNALSIKGSLTNNGALNTNSSTVTFSGNSAQMITGAVTFNNLTINNNSGVTAANNITVNGALYLQSPNASATTGALNMGSNTLNMGNNATTTGTGDVTGIVRRQQTFVGNTAYTFGNANTNITFTNFPGTTKPTWISCKIVIGSAPSWRATGIKRYYTFAIDGGNDRTALRLHYLDSELDPSETDETKLVLWDAHNGSPWTLNHAHGKSNFSPTDNWTGLTGMSIQYIAPTSDLDNKQWGLAYSNVPKKIWTGIGADQNDWSLPGNWNGGVPTIDDDVLIPAGCTYYPTKNLNPSLYPAVAKTIEIENGASLTVDNYDITVSGAAGAWMNNGTFVPGNGKVIFNHNNTAEFVTIGGTNNFYNLEIGGNTVIRPNKDSYISISGALNVDPSSFLELTTTTNTFEFKGGASTILNPVGLGGKFGYQNLILSNTGTVAFPAQLNISGNLTANTTIDGTTNNSTLVLNGSTAQTISGSGTFNLQNLTINNAAGVIGSADMTVNGTLLFVTDNPVSNDKGALAMSTDKILDMGPASTTSGPGDVSGIIRRNHTFETSTHYTFGHEDNGLTFATVSGTPAQVLPTSVSLKVSIGTTPNWSAYTGTAPTNPISRSFEIIQTGGSGNRAIMQVHYRDNEVPAGIAEDKLSIWTCSYNSGTFYNKESGKSNYNTTDNFVSIQDVNFNIIPSTWGYFKATIAPTAASNYTWTGAVSNSWANTSNWTPNGVPSSTTGAIIPNTYATPNAPKLASSTSCKSIQINAGGVLNAPDADGILQLTGANNTWTVEAGGVFNPNTSTVVFTANATTVGNTSIVGSTNFYNLTIGTGALLRPAAESHIGISGILTNNGILDAATTENTIEFNGSTSQNILNPNGNTPGYHNLLLSGSGIKIFPTTLNITDEFTNNADSVNSGTGTVLFNGNYLYNPKISGTSLTHFNNLTIDNPGSSVLALSNVDIKGTLSISTGTTLNMGTNSLSGTMPTVTGTGSIQTQNAGSTPLPSGKTWPGTIIYNGTINQTAVPGTYSILTISNEAGCIASGDITVDKTLNLSANNPSATHGLLEMVSDWQSYPSAGNATPQDIASYTLFMGPSATTIGTGDVTGIIKRNYAIEINKSYTFGNEFSTISLSPGTSTVVPSSITLVSKIGSTPAGKANAIQRSYQIIPAANGANCFISANFHYIDSELQSSISPYFQNTESKLATWDYNIDGGVSVPDEHGRAAYDSNNNFVGLSNIPVSYFIYNESTNNWRTIFTLGDHSNTNFLTWKGSTSSDWTDGRNWVPYGNVPTATTFVVIPNAATTLNSPELPASASVNTLTIENGGILIMGNSTLTIENTMSGGWEDQNPSGNDPATSTVVFANPGATVSGTASFYNLTINSNATLTNAANSTVKVSGSVINNGSWFTNSSDNTVEYNGTRDQAVVLPSGTPDYNNLVLSGDGVVSMPQSPLNISGNLTIGMYVIADINQNMNIKGDIINNSSTLTQTAGTITLNGTKNQTISGSGASIFNNLTIDNSGYTVKAENALEVVNTLTLGAGAALNMGTQQLTAIRSNSGTGTIFTQNTGTSPLPAGVVWNSKIVYNNQTTTQNVVAGTYNNLQISNPVGTTATGNINTSTLTIDNRAILNMGLNELSNITTNTGTGTLTTQNSSSSPIPAGKTWTSGIVFNGSSAQTAVEGTFNTLTIDNTSGVSLASQANVLVQGSLIINNSKKLIIPTQTSMNAQYISNNAGTQGITIKSSSTVPNGSLIFYNTSSFPVSATVEMYSKAAASNQNPYSNYKWEFFGIPLQSVTADPTFYGSSVRKYNESTVPTRWENLVNSSILTPFTGYEITQPTAKTIYFKGQLVNSSITKSLQYTSGVQYAGQNIFSNPYTAAIDIAKLNFGSGLTDEDKTVYLYNTGSLNDWQAAEGATGDTPGQYAAIPQYAVAEGIPGIQGQIPSMQGFLVITSTSNRTLEIPYTAVVKNTFKQRVRSNSNAMQVYTIISVAGSRYSDKMWIITNQDCTHGYDNGWDGKKLLGSTLAPQIWAMETKGDYQVSGVDNINNTQLGFMCGNDSVYTLTFTHESSTSNYPALYLVDLNNNQVTDITASGSQYTFVSKQTTVPTTARFKIVTSLGMVTEDGYISGKLNIFNSKKIVYVENSTGMKGDLMIYDLAGRFIQQHPFNANGLTTINTNLSSGVYLLKTNTSDNENMKRIVIH